jgi:hypothetical protein
LFCELDEAAKPASAIRVGKNSQGGQKKAILCEKIYRPKVPETHITTSFLAQKNLNEPLNYLLFHTTDQV